MENIMKRPVLVSFRARVLDKTAWTAT